MHFTSMYITYICIYEKSKRKIKILNMNNAYLSLFMRYKGISVVALIKLRAIKLAKGHQ